MTAPTEREGGANPKRVFEVFDAVCDLSVDARETALLERCGDDVVLKREVEELLRADCDPVTGLERRRAQAATSRLPERIGEYELKLSHAALRADEIITRARLLYLQGEIS